jgi:hypothetical protein
MVIVVVGAIGVVEDVELLTSSVSDAASLTGVVVVMTSTMRPESRHVLS